MKEPNEHQLKFLQKIRFGDEEWEKDIIWIKRMDSVSSPKIQRKVNKLFEDTIKREKLFSKKTKNYNLISEADNVWESQRLNNGK